MIPPPDSLRIEWHRNSEHQPLIRSPPARWQLVCAGDLRGGVETVVKLQRRSMKSMSVLPSEGMR